MLFNPTTDAARLQALRTDILAGAAGVGAIPANLVTAYANSYSSDVGAAIADLYNATFSPDFWVWRTAVSKAEYLQTTSADGTTFSFVGTGFITRAQGERDAWHELFDESGFANPSLANVRQAVADIFSGATAPAPANRTHLLTISRRKSHRIEKLFATGTGSTASPGTMAVEGSLSFDDVGASKNA